MKRRLIATILISLLLLSTVCGTALAAKSVEFADANVPSPIINGDLLLDYGDAPPPYPTTLADGGASHSLYPDFYLGTLIDGDPDGQPVPPGEGDDNNFLDDEDGVTFYPPIRQGETANIDVWVTAEFFGGLLDAWVDFNGDGDWKDPDEQIFSGEMPWPGHNQLQFTVPAGASTGLTFARFRFSTEPGLGPDGPAYDGEVEDYAITIEPAEPLGSISGTKFNDLNGDGTKDVGEPGLKDWPIKLFDGGGGELASTKTDVNGLYSFESLTAGSYKVAEEAATGWIQTFPPIPGYHQFDLPAGVSIENVDFGNQEEGNGPEPGPTIEVGGNIYPVNRMAILAPWIALAVAMITGAAVIVRHRRSQS